MTTSDKPIRTKSGKVLTDVDLQVLAAEAKAGYDVVPLLVQQRDAERALVDDMAAVLTKVQRKYFKQSEIEAVLARYKEMRRQ